MRALPVMSIVFAACAADPHAAVPDGDAFVRRQWSARAGDGTWRCAVVDSASAWREARERIGAAGEALRADWCTFATERAVVVQMPGSVQPPVAWQVHDEEHVDVLILTPRPAAAAVSPGWVLVLAVPARAAELAVVARVPDAAGPGTETTLGVFAGR